MCENLVKFGIIDDWFEYNGVVCFNIDVLNIGLVWVIVYDIAVVNKVIELVKENRDEVLIFYILVCCIGFFILKIKKKI